MAAQKTAKVSYCTTCKGRLHHLMQTLPANLEAEKDNSNVEFVILDYGSDDREHCGDLTLANWLWDNYKAEIHSGRIRYVRSEQQHFKMAHAKNMAHRLATGDIFCNVDADNFIAPQFSRWLIQQYSEATHFLTCMAPTSVEELQEKRNDELAGRISAKFHGASGRMAIDRDTFYRLGGYDEKYNGWGFDDLDLMLRAKSTGIPIVRMPESLAGDVIRHDRAARLENLTPQAREESEKRLNRTREKVFEDNCDAYQQARAPVANEGKNVGCGVVHVNFEDKPVPIHALGWQPRSRDAGIAGQPTEEAGLRQKDWVNRVEAGAAVQGRSSQGF